MIKFLLSHIEASRLYQWLRFRMNHGLVAFIGQNALAGRQGLRIAELACGSGFSAHLLAQQPGVSLSLAGDINLDDYREAAIPNYQASFALMDMLQPPLAAETFDLVWNSSSVEEFDDPQGAVRAMAHLAKKGGYVFVGVPNRYGLSGLLHLIPSRRLHVWLGRIYSHRQLKVLLETAGLRVERQTTYLFGIFVGALARKA